MTRAGSTRQLGAALLMVVTAACSGGSRPDSAASAQRIVVTISPDSVTLAPGSLRSFTASVTGTSDQSVAWSIPEGAAGGSIGADGVYAAPATPGSYHVVATSHANPQSSATAGVTVTASGQVVTVAVSPVAVTVATGASQTFSCNISGASDSSCTWAVQEGASGGTITTSGTYTAPRTPGTYHVVATSRADATQVAVAAVTVTASPVSVAVAVSPLAATLSTGASQTFSCTVTGSEDTSCTWSVAEGAAGGAVTGAGVYTAPQAAGTYHLLARSGADASRSATATLTVTAPPPAAAVAVSPTAATIVAGSSQTFTCTVTGSSDASCTWSVQEGSSGGVVTSAGVYTAPQAAGTYHVVARRSADPADSAAATVTVTAPSQPIGVSLSPLAATIVAGGSQSFTCSVSGSTDTACTWSVQEGAAGGAVTSAGVYTAPQTAGTYHVVATSHADTTASAAATVTVTAPPVIRVSVSPATASVSACQTYPFTASVTGTSNSAVNWSVQEGSSGGTITSAGVYTAPSTAGTYHVVGTSQVDPTKNSVAIVTVTAEAVLSVELNPQAPTVQPGGTVQFTATVTTTCGSFTQTQAVAANGTLSN